MKRLFLVLLIFWLYILIIGLISPRAASDTIITISTFLRVGMDYYYIWTMKLIMALKGQPI